MLTCSGYWKYIHVFFLWMTFLRNDYIRILSEECYVKYLNLLWREAVVLDVTVTYSLETWKPYYASSGKLEVSYEMNTQ
jgi:hypothetical protein